jgi:predicted nucleic acid-binding protein
VKRIGVTTTQAEHRVQQMRRAFPFAAEESRGYERLIPAMANDRKDRHVLAAAVAAGAALIVTANERWLARLAASPYAEQFVLKGES